MYEHILLCLHSRDRRKSKIVALVRYQIWPNVATSNKLTNIATIVYFIKQIFDDINRPTLQLLDTRYTIINKININAFPISR